MSRFKGTACDSCGVSVNGIQMKGWAEVTFFCQGETERLDLCPQCAAYVSGFIVDGCRRDYKRDERMAER